MPNAYPTLLSPVQLGSLELNNRVIMAPMTRSRAGEGDVATELMAEYYSQRASAGLIITEASPISPQGTGNPHTPAIYSPEQIAGWKLVTDAVHVKSGKIFLQLQHQGRLSHSVERPDGGLPVAPSAIKPEGTIYTRQGPLPYEMPVELTIAEISEIVQTFKQAAENAKLAGFDGVEIHGANGYLIDQFLRDGTNQRTDMYGGSIENRARLLKEVVEAVIPVFGADATGVRISPVFDSFSMSDSNPQDLYNYVAEMLSQYNLAYLHGAQIGKAEFDYAKVKELFKGTYIANCGYDASRAEEAIQSGISNLVSFGMPFIANPDLVERFQQNAPFNEVDTSTFFQGGAKGYTDYPTL